MAADPIPIDTSRRTAHEIFEKVSDNARDELARSSHALAFSGLAGGITMGLTGISVAAIRAVLGDSPAAQLVSYLFYPIGFMAVIIGRAQLFTENTLYPVVLVLKERRHLLATARLWAVVFAANVLGAFAFSLLAVHTSSLQPKIADRLVQLGVEALARPSTNIFWSAVIGGWIIALVAWMVSASHFTIGQIAVVWLLTFVVGVGHFAHCIAGSGEVLAAVVHGAMPPTAYLHWVGLATAGNVMGGVIIVSFLNWGQVHAGETR
ncbi:MAG: formate/nitrite transporter family protein [Terriglobales bacterium]